MESTLFVIAISSVCALAACSSSKKTASVAPVVAAPAVAAPVQTAYAPASVHEKNLKILKPNAAKPTMEFYFYTGNECNCVDEKAIYTKTGANTAKLEYLYWGDSGTYTLQFTSPTGGKVAGKNLTFRLSSL